ncbi:hypothetical protein V6N13_097573 [Hibiscus sabdariffa]|uniref:Uncharacterized protein n=2 Tax=Hibiscus sabdariffa TaxID=183260 RepID=A0ABR2B2Z2_9ROSI
MKERKEKFQRPLHLFFHVDHGGEKKWFSSSKFKPLEFDSRSRTWKLLLGSLIDLVFGSIALRKPSKF